MAILVKPAAKSAHWYTSSGEPAHRQATARGGERATTIADAKRLHLLPSVTSVLGILAKPGLDTAAMVGCSIWTVFFAASTITPIS